MRPLGRELLGGLGRVALTATALLLWLAPGSASAGCGGHARASASSTWRTAGLAAALAGGSTTAGTPTAPPRCSGPSCSKNVPTPPPSVVGPDLGPHRVDSLLPTDPPPPASASRAFLRADAPLAPAFPTSGVFHPPRPFA